MFTLHHRYRIKTKVREQLNPVKSEDMAHR